MRSHIHCEVARVVESPFRLKISLTAQVVIEKVVVGRAILEEGPTYVDPAVPCVLDRAVRHIRLNHLVQIKFRHQVDSTVVLKVGLVEHEPNLIGVIDVVQHHDKALGQLLLEDFDTQVGQREGQFDASEYFKDGRCHQERVDVRHHYSRLRRRFLHNVTEVVYHDVHVLELDPRQEQFYHRQLEVHEEGGVKEGL